MTETIYKCEYPGCDKELEYGGRGRPPRRCEEHKGLKIGSDQNKNSTSDGERMPAPRPRPRPGASQEASTEAPRPRPGQSLQPLGKPDVQSRAKAVSSANRANQQVELSGAEKVPFGANGRPLVRISMAASELVPTGQYANVSVGPAQIVAYIDLDRVSNGDGYFTEAEKDTITKALNELASMVEGDVVAVQRNLVLESMQDQLAS